MGNLINGLVNKKRKDGRAIEVNGVWYSDFKIVNANVGDEVSIDYNAVEKDGRLYHNITKLTIIAAGAPKPFNQFMPGQMAREEKAITMLVAYAKDAFVAMVEHAVKANIAIDTTKIWGDANARVLESYEFFKEAMND